MPPLISGPESGQWPGTVRARHRSRSPQTVRETSPDAASLPSNSTTIAVTSIATMSLLEICTDFLYIIAVIGAGLLRIAGCSPSRTSLTPPPSQIDKHLIAPLVVLPR